MPRIYTCIVKMNILFNLMIVGLCVISVGSIKDLVHSVSYDSIVKQKERQHASCEPSKVSCPDGCHVTGLVSISLLHWRGPIQRVDSYPFDMSHFSILDFGIFGLGISTFHIGAQVSCVMLYAS